MKKIKIRVDFEEEVLGMTPSNPDLHREYIASRSADAAKMEEEQAALPTDTLMEKSMLIFPRDEKGNPFVWDYQWKGFFKDSQGMLHRVEGTKASKLTAHKKVIDGLLFPSPRKIPLHLPEGAKLGSCTRSLRADGPSGSRTALATSESAPVGSWMEFEVTMLKDELEDVLREWMDYGSLRGWGGWRNSGKGRFRWTIVGGDEAKKAKKGKG